MNSQILSTLFVDSSQQLQLTDILSSVSDSVPIIYANSSGVITTYNARFFCLGNLLIQFNDSANTVNPASFDSLTFPYPYDGTPYSVVSSNYSSAITFTNLKISLLNGSTNFNFLSIGPRPSLFYPVVPFLTTGSPQISVSNDIITFTFNQSGTIIFYKSGKITSYTAIGAGGQGGDGFAGSDSIAGGGGGGGGGGSIVYSASYVTCDINSKITVTCGTNTINYGNTKTSILPNNPDYVYNTALAGNDGTQSNNIPSGVGGYGANNYNANGQPGTGSGDPGQAGRDGTATILSGGGGGGGQNGGFGGAGGQGYSTWNAGSGGGGAGGKNNNAGNGGAAGGGDGYGGAGGAGGNSGSSSNPGAAGAAGGGGGGGGAGGAGGNSGVFPYSAGAGGIGGSGRVVFVIDFSS